MLRERPVRDLTAGSRKIACNILNPPWLLGDKQYVGGISCGRYGGTGLSFVALSGGKIGISLSEI